jgi:hypothetical protein
VSKTDDIVNLVYQWVNEQYNEGRVTVITDEELERITLSIMEENADKKNKNIEEEKRK